MRITLYQVASINEIKEMAANDNSSDLINIEMSDARTAKLGYLK